MYDLPIDCKAYKVYFYMMKTFGFRNISDEKYNILVKIWYQISF